MTPEPVMTHSAFVTATVEGKTAWHARADASCAHAWRSITVTPEADRQCSICVCNSGVSDYGLACILPATAV